LPVAIGLASALAAGCAAAIEAQAVPEALLTRAERTEYRETSSYADVMALAERLAARVGDDVHLASMGLTGEGRSLPLLIVGASGAAPDDVRSTGKLRVYIQGNIHAGEVEGKEASLMLVRDYLAGMYREWADELVLLIAPIYNADGNERVALDNRPLQYGPIGGMGQRPNAQGLDLNRDHMKLDSPEARAFAGVLEAYDPHVTVDLHTTNGTDHAYHLTYAPPLHPNTPPAIDALLRAEWLPQVTRRIESTDGWKLYYYGNLSGDPPGWYTFDHRPRFNNNYVGLRNRFAILSEAYAYLTFEERVRVTRRFVDEVLAFAGEHAAAIRAVVEAVDAAPVAGRTLALRAGVRRSAAPVPILLGAVAEEPHPVTGLPMHLRLDVETPTPMYEYGAFNATESAVAPAAYYVSSSASEAIERLRLHGVRSERLPASRTLEVERFQLDSTAVADVEFQGRRERTVWGTWVPVTETLPAGTVAVPMDQPLARLAFSLLEPRSDDGFTAWALFDEAIERGEYPVRRASAR
jgi:hypothetical protein